MDENEFIAVDIRNPRTHLKRGRPQFTDYEIFVSTNSMVFAQRESRARRRFSEFEWLRKTLDRNGSITTKPPPLPNKKLLGRFNKEFIEQRRVQLQEFIVRVVAITSYLSDAALHLFLQSRLSVPEMERILEGRDCRDVTDLIAQQERKKTVSLSCLDRKTSFITNTDSGYSGSNRFEGHCSGRVAQSNSCPVCQGRGNGWSSGFAQLSSPGTASEQHGAINKGRCLACRRMSLPFHAASVLPTGQLVVAVGEKKPTDLLESFGYPSENRESDSDNSYRCREEKCKKCNQYDADDETDAGVVDYDVINTSKLRVDKWLNSISSSIHAEYDVCESTTTEDESDPDTGRCVPEYDVISVPCSRKGLLTSHYSFRSRSDQSEDDTYRDDDSECSDYSVVHSSIGGLDLGKNKNSCSSTSSLSSAGVYRTYDVVEMVELR